MNRDNIIRMSQEADDYADNQLSKGEFHPDWHDVRDQRFAALVYEYAWKDAALAATRTVIDAAVLAEREACAKVCDEQSDKDGPEGYYANACAAAIRARSE